MHRRLTEVNTISLVLDQGVPRDAAELLRTLSDECPCPHLAARTACRPQTALTRSLGLSAKLIGYERSHDA
jgi:hypothetical protein